MRLIALGPVGPDWFDRFGHTSAGSATNVVAAASAVATGKAEGVVVAHSLEIGPRGLLVLVKEVRNCFIVDKPFLLDPLAIKTLEWAAQASRYSHSIAAKKGVENSENQLGRRPGCSNPACGHAFSKHIEGVGCAASGCSCTAYR